MKVFVTGGTGAIGRYAVPALLGAGHDVTALARTPEKARGLREQGATPVAVSLFQRSRLAEAFAGHDAVVNLATSMPSTSAFMFRRAWRATERVRSEGSAAVAGAALDAGVGRLVQESVAMLYRDNRSDWIDEDAPVDHYPATRGNFAAEASAQRFADAGSTAIVLRLGMFLGPGAAHSEEMLGYARRHIGVVVGRPRSYIPSIHLVDAGSAVAAALTAPAGTYNVVDDVPLTTSEYADALAAAAATSMWFRVPGSAAVLFGTRLTSLVRSLRVDNRRFRDATGWSPHYSSAREGWLATAAALAK